jgi:hypothetical protein
VNAARVGSPIAVARSSARNVKATSSLAGIVYWPIRMTPGFPA